MNVFLKLVPLVCLSLTIPAHVALSQYQALENTGETAGPTEADSSSYEWMVARDNGGFTMSGSVPYQSVEDLLRNRMNADAATDVSVEDGAPLGFLRDAMRAIDAVDLLDEGQGGYWSNHWQLSGRVSDEASIATLESLLASRTGTGELWQIDVRIDSAETSEADSETISPEPSDFDGDESAEDIAGEVERVLSESEDVAQDDAEIPEGVRETETATPAAIEVCRERTQAFMEDKTIGFASGSARIAPDAAAILSELAPILALCPSAPVYIEGHTDAVGNDQANLQLSLARAEAVLDAFVERGIAPSRLYAVGYGASLPIASNDTVSGRAENRRIVFSFEDIAEQGGD